MGNPTQTQANGNQVRVLRTLSNGVSADKAFQLAKNEGLILISNKKADNLLKSDDWKTVKEAWPIHTGTMTAFTEPGKKLGATVEYKDPGSGILWVFEVPSGVGFRSMWDAVLAVEHPNYDIEIQTSKNRIVVHPQKKMILPVTDFPSKDGWYATDSITGIPVNKPLDSGNPDARYLWRIVQRVGPVVRGYCSVDYRGGVFLGYDGGGRPSGNLGVLVEQELTLEAALKQLEQLRGKLQLAKEIAADAKPKLSEVAKIAKPELLQELTELIKLHTEQ